MRTRRVDWRSCLTTLAFTGMVLSAPAALAKDGFFALSDWDPYFFRFLNHDPVKLTGNWRTRYAVPPPPTRKSVIQSELAALKALKPLRPERQAKIEAHVEELVAPFLDALGCTAEAAPDVVTLIDDIQVDALIVVVHFKLKYSRLRPRQLDPEIKPSIAPPGHAAYPSGHAAQVHSTAYLLGEIIPSKAAAVEKVAERISFDREVAGVHYRSDTVAGKILGLQIAEDYLRFVDKKGTLKQIEDCS